MNIFATKNIKVWPFVLPMTPSTANARKYVYLALSRKTSAQRRRRIPLAATAAAHEFVASKTKRGTVIVLPQEWPSRFAAGGRDPFNCAD